MFCPFMLCFYINIGIVFSSKRIPEFAEYVLAMGKHWNPKQLANFPEFSVSFLSRSRSTSS